VKPLAQVLLALLLAGLQAAVLRWVGGGTLSASLLAACVVYVALHDGNVDGAVASAGIGYVLDIVTGSPKGLMTFLAVLLFVGVRAVGNAVDVRSRAGFAALSGLTAFAMSLGALILTRYTVAPEAQPGSSLLPRMLVEAVVTAAASPLILAVMRRMDALFQRDEPGLLR
jgi:rod shape-determining protein MreD